MTSSDSEWVQNNENEPWDEDEVTGTLERIMTKAADAVIEKQTTITGSLVDVETERPRRGRGGDPLAPVDLRPAAVVLAVARVARGAIDRGIWPETSVRVAGGLIPLRGGARAARAPRP